MSVEALQAVWEHSEQRGEARLVLLAIANFANGEGLAWPGAEKLANMTRLSRQSVWRIIRRVLDSGELALDRRGGGRGMSNSYRITLLDIQENSHFPILFPMRLFRSKTVTLDPRNSHFR